MLYHITTQPKPNYTLILLALTLVVGPAACSGSSAGRANNTTCFADADCAEGQTCNLTSLFCDDLSEVNSDEEAAAELPTDESGDADPVDVGDEDPTETPDVFEQPVCVSDYGCPEEFICRENEPLTSDDVDERLAVLEAEYAKPWSIRCVENTVGTDRFEWVREYIEQIPTGNAIAERLKSFSKQEVFLDYDDDGVTKESHFFVYDSENLNNEKRPLLVIMPPVYDLSVLDEGMAVHYVGMGFQVVALDFGGFDFVHPTQAMDEINQSLVTALGKTQRAIDYAVTYRNADVDNVGIFGFSLGGTLAAMAFTVNDNIKVMASVLAGGNIAEMLTNSTQLVASAYRHYQKYMMEIKTQEEYYDALNESIAYDPADFAHRRNQEDVYLVLSESDTMVPTRNQLALEAAFCASEERGTSRHLTGAHFWAIVKDLANRGPINNFFKQKLMGDSTSE